MVYKHLSFDLWLTLIKSNPNFKPAKVEYLRKNYNPNGLSTSEIDSIMRKVDKHCTRLCEITGKNFDPLNMWALVLFEMGYEANSKSLSLAHLTEIHKVIQEMYLENIPLLYSEETLPTLESLYKKTELMTIGSNTGFVTGKSVRRALKELGILQFFRGEIFSDECGWAKPSEKFFDEVMKLSPHSKRYTLHIGDNDYADRFGAEFSGITAFVINNEMKGNHKISDLLKL